MLQQLFIGTILMVLSFSGCTLINKSQTKIIKQPVIESKEEKVWIEAKTSKMWVNPQVDENGDMVDGHYKYMVMVPGHWAVKDNGRK